MVSGGLRLASLNQHVHTSILLCLHGHEAAAVAAVAPFLMQRLKEEVVWKTFLQQEAPCKGVQLLQDSSPMTAYYKFMAQSLCRTLKWHRVTCSHSLGAREGSPAVFCWKGYLFVYGGWGRSGPSNDLHVGALRHPFKLKRIHIAGNPPPPSYEMKVTVLSEESDEEEGSSARTSVRVAVTGGYLSGGYHRESGVIGIFELSSPAEDPPAAPPAGDAADYRASGVALPTARWCYNGPMRPRSNHTATYVPPGVSGTRYTHGYLLVFGGNVGGVVVNTVDVLDLEDMTWEGGKLTTGEIPSPRNSHSALLLPTRNGHELLVMGGGTGDVRSGGPPRGGQDLSSAYWLDPRSFAWRREKEADAASLGRGHIAVNLFGTAVVVGGGRVPHFQTTAFRSGTSSLGWEVESTVGDNGLPPPRILGGGCALPDGTLLIYGGWHPYGDTFDDIWAAHVDGVVTPFCKPLCNPASSSESPAFPSRPPLRRKNRNRPPAPTTWWACLQKLGSKAWKTLLRAKSRCFPSHEYGEVATSE